METVTQHQKTWTLGANEEHEDLIYSFITEMKKINDHKSTFKEEELFMVSLDMSLVIKSRSVLYVEAVLLEKVLSCGFDYRARRVLFWKGTVFPRYPGFGTCGQQPQLHID